MERALLQPSLTVLWTRRMTPVPTRRKFRVLGTDPRTVLVTNMKPKEKRCTAQAVKMEHLKTPGAAWVLTWTGRVALPLPGTQRFYDPHERI